MEGRGQTVNMEVWETLMDGLMALDNAYGDEDKIDRAYDWLTQNYPD